MQFSRILPGSSEDEEWTTLYTFSEFEFFQRDIDAANVVASTFDDMPFPQSVMCSKRFTVSVDEIRQTGVYNMNEDDDQEIMRIAEQYADEKGLVWVGQWSLEGTKAVKRIGGKSVEEIHFSSEKERVLFLRDKVGISIGEDDKQWIVGRKAALQTE